MVGESATSETPATVLSLFFSTPKRLGATHYCVTCRALSNSFALELLTHAASIKHHSTSATPLKRPEQLQQQFTLHQHLRVHRADHRNTHHVSNAL